MKLFTLTFIQMFQSSAGRCLHLRQRKRGSDTEGASLRAIPRLPHLGATPSHSARAAHTSPAHKGPGAFPQEFPASLPGFPRALLTKNFQTPAPGFTHEAAFKPLHSCFTLPTASFPALL